MKTLILTVGLPRSGKSTWARSTTLPIVSPDAIRLIWNEKPFDESTEPQIWGFARLMVAALFEAGHEKVILDACNISQKRRDEWLDIRWELEFKEFYVSARVCKSRAILDEREDLFPVIERMAAEYEPVTKNNQIATPIATLEEFEQQQKAEKG